MAKGNVLAILKTGAILTIYVVAFTALMVLTNEAVKDQITQNKMQEKMEMVRDVLPLSLRKQNPAITSWTIEPNSLLGTEKPTTAYQVTVGENDVKGVVLEAVAKGGYGGNIRLLIAIAPDWSLLGVRVLEHKETPAIGDYVAEKPGNGKPRVWLGQFNGRSLKNPTIDQWVVRKDGGAFDYIAGATISPRAVVAAVKQGLIFARENKELFSIKS